MQALQQLLDGADLNPRELAKLDDQWWAKEVLDSANPNFWGAWMDYSDSFPYLPKVSYKKLCGKILVLSQLTSTPLRFCFFLLTQYQEEEELLELAPVMQFLSTNFLPRSSEPSITREDKPYLEHCLERNPQLLACILAYGTRLNISEGGFEEYIWLITIFCEHPEHTQKMFDWLWSHQLYAIHHEYLELLWMLAHVYLKYPNAPQKIKVRGLDVVILTPVMMRAGYFFSHSDGPTRTFRLDFPRIAEPIQPREKDNLGLTSVGDNLLWPMLAWKQALADGLSQKDFLNLVMSNKAHINEPLNFVQCDTFAQYGIELEDLNLKGLLEKTGNDESFPLIWRAVRQELDDEVSKGRLYSDEGLGQILTEQDGMYGSNIKIEAYYHHLLQTRVLQQ